MPKRPLDSPSMISASSKISPLNRLEANEAPPPKTRWARWSARLTSFFVGQGVVQLFNLLTGFLLIRWLSVSDYAVYTLVTGFQGTAGLLVELGLGSSIVALLGGRTEKHVMGGYIRSTRHYRNRFFLLLLPAIAIIFPILTFRQGVTWPVMAVLLGAILTAIYFESWSAYYSVPPLVHQELGTYYQPMALAGAGRLATSFILNGSSMLTSATAAWTSSAALVFQGWLYKRHSGRHIHEPVQCDPRTNEEVLRYIRPMIPGAVFFAFQGQINVFLISWFGHTRSIAEVGALGKIGQLFVMLGAFNSVVIAPNIAKLPRALLACRYRQILVGALFVSAGFLGVSLYVPEVLLWILGPKYMHLKDELVWIMAGACLGYLTGVMWTMHVARKWNFAWGVWTYIAAVACAQIYGVVFMDLSTTTGVVRLSVLVAAATVAVQILFAIYGFLFHEPDRNDK